MTLDDLFEELIPMVSEVGALVDVPIESEDFFSNIIEQFEGTRKECLDYIKSNLKNWFKFVKKGPDWIQEAEWQFANGKPLVFVGQINIPKETGYFHDDAAFFIFWDTDSGETKTVIQVA